MDRLVVHMNSVEDYFRIYYEKLETMRKNMLKEEYLINKTMEKYE
jgi:hypothetical protein